MLRVWAFEKNANVYMLGEIAGVVDSFEYASDGKHLELGLNLEPEFKSQVVWSSRIAIGKDANGSSLEIVRVSDLLGMNIEPAAGGVIVSAVSPDGPAATAGVMVGDKVTSVAGKPTRNASSLSSATKDLNAGDQVAIKLLRKNKPLTLKAIADPAAGPCDIAGR